MDTLRLPLLDLSVYSASVGWGVVGAGFFVFLDVLILDLVIKSGSLTHSWLA